MTATTGAPWSLVYQTFTDPADISAAVQDLADSIDTAAQTLYDNQAAGAAKPACRGSSAAAQSIPNSTQTDITWPAGSQSFDNDSMFDNTATTSRVTFTSTGIYLVALRVTFSSTAAGGGVRQTSFTHSALGVVARNCQLGTASFSARPFITAVVPAYVAGQFMTFQAFQTSSAALDLATRQVQAFRLSTL
jgi:hypothetical protein